MDDLSTVNWLESLKRGDSHAARELWNRYVSRLTHLAERRMGGLPRRAVDEEDVVVSAFNSFIQGMRGGKFPKLADETDLWSLLVTITARKVTAQRRRHFAARRNRGQVRGESIFANAADSAHEMGIDGVGGPENSPAFAAEVTEECRLLFEQLDDPLLCDIARWKLEGYTNEEIAEKSDRSVRTIERKLMLIRDCWNRAQPGQ